MNKNVVISDKDGLKYVQFESFKKYEDMVSHGFMTRIGGVSQGYCRSLNLGFNRGDSRENVLENFRLTGEALKIKCENMVLSKQTHGNRIKEVSEIHRGNGIFRENELEGYDGLMTNKRNVALVTFYADCVPVFFLDPKKQSIAISHSGWRGTVKEIASETVKEMREAYGNSPRDILAAIGPSIGNCCFEVSEDVYGEFMKILPWSAGFSKKTGEGKWHINLQEIIKKSLMNSGISEENITLSEICTKCNKDMFFSHRGDNGKTGSLAGIIQLKG